MKNIIIEGDTCGMWVKNEITIFLKNLGYKLFAKCFNTVFFMEVDK